MANNCGLRPSGVGTVGSGELLLWPAGQVPACADAGGDARATRGRPPAPALPALSIGHIDSISKPGIANKRVTSGKPKPSPTASRSWLGASRADLPGLSDKNPFAAVVPLTGGKKKAIVTFSNASRRTLTYLLATINRSVLAYTMALTLPGDLSGITGAWAKGCFRKLTHRFTSARDPLIRRIGFLWKQELQERGAVHYHLALWGLTEAERLHVQTWFAENWNDLICENSTEKERRKQFAQHMRQENFQEIKDFAGYFAKYLGKDEKAKLTEEPIPGRWWGKVNVACIPFVEETVTELPERVRVLAHRTARKLQQSQAKAGKYKSLMRKAGMVHLIGDSKGQPVVSQFRYMCGGFERLNMPLTLEAVAGNLPDFRATEAHFKAEELRKRDNVERMKTGEERVREGKKKPRTTKYWMRFAPIKMIGKNATAIVAGILEYALARAAADDPTRGRIFDDPDGIPF